MIGLGILLLGGMVLGNGCNSSSSSKHLSRSTYVSPNAEQNAEFGVSVASVGDIDADGVPDVLIGAPNETVGDSTEAGRAYLFSGSDDALLRTLVAPDSIGRVGFGGNVAGPGDINGDGTPDLLVGASGPTSAGRAYMFDGSSGEVLYTLTSPNSTSNGFFAVSSLTPVEDVDGDGVKDLLIGGFGESRAYLFSGAEGEMLHTLTSPDGGGAFGGATAGIGDLNGDGVTELLVGAAAQTVNDMPWAGRAYVFSGASGTLLRKLTSPNAKAKGIFGYSVAGIGDVNKDNTPDYAVFARFENGGGPERAGRVYLYSGAKGTVLRTLASPNAEQRGLFGYSLAGIGDITGDERADLALTARKESVGDAEEAGRVYLIDGATGDSLQTLTSPNAGAKGQLGYSLSVIRPEDTSEAAGLLVGAYKETVDSLQKAGRAYRFPL